MKKCSKCNKYKSKDLFHKDKSKKSGVHSWCKICCKKYTPFRYRNELNITLKEYDQMLEQQNRVCIICGKCETRKHISGAIRWLSIDHNHKTGKIRGLLCDKCNRLLGIANDNVTILLNAANYLAE